MKDVVAIHLVTTEKRGDKTLGSTVEKYSTVTEARTDMRAYLREWLDEGWLRVPRPGAVKRKPPMSLSISDGEETITCTIVVTKGPRRKLIAEPNLSE